MESKMHNERFLKQNKKCCGPDTLKYEKAQHTHTHCDLFVGKSKSIHFGVRASNPGGKSHHDRR